MEHEEILTELEAHKEDIEGAIDDLGNVDLPKERKESARTQLLYACEEITKLARQLEFNY